MEVAALQVARGQRLGIQGGEGLVQFVHQEEAEVVFRIDAGVYDGDGHIPPVVTLDEVRQLQSVVRDVHMDPVLVHYVTQLVGATREPGRFLNPQLARLVEYGASPRASIAFSKSARALALLSGRNHVVPDDIKRLAHRVLRHRLILGFEADAVEVTPEIVIDAVLQSVRVP